MLCFVTFLNLAAIRAAVLSIFVGREHNEGNAAPTADRTVGAECRCGGHGMGYGIGGVTVRAGSAGEGMAWRCRPVADSSNNSCAEIGKRLIDARLRGRISGGFREKNDKMRCAERIFACGIGICGTLREEVERGE